VRLAVDVGLELLVLFFQEKRTKKSAAIDATPPHTPTAGMTWLLGHGRKRKTVYPLAGSRKSCNFAGGWSRKRIEKQRTIKT
jgi:hypothetical protein